MSFSSKTINYFCNLKTPHIKSSGVELINPYEIDEVKEIVIFLLSHKTTKQFKTRGKTGLINMLNKHNPDINFN